MNSQEIGPLVADFMDKLDSDFPDGTLGAVILLAEIQIGDDNESKTLIRHVSTDGRAHVQIGLLTLAIKGINPT